MKKKNLAWHFVGNKLRDGRDIPPDGVWLEHDGPLVMCESGLHFSRHPFDALQYAPGEVLCLVEIGGTVIDGDDKGVCSRRRIIARVDATDGLRYFARMCALSVSHLWDMPDVVINFLMGDESLRSEAESAAWSAADSAAWSAADSAADSAVCAAAWSAADLAVRSAARSEQKQRWLELVTEAFEDFL